MAAWDDDEIQKRLRAQRKRPKSPSSDLGPVDVAAGVTLSGLLGGLIGRGLAPTCNCPDPVIIHNINPVVELQSDLLNETKKLLSEYITALNQPRIEQESEERKNEVDTLRQTLEDQTAELRRVEEDARAKERKFAERQEQHSREIDTLKNEHQAILTAKQEEYEAKVAELQRVHLEQIAEKQREIALAQVMAVQEVKPQEHEQPRSFEEVENAYITTIQGQLKAQFDAVQEETRRAQQATQAETEARITAESRASIAEAQLQSCRSNLSGLDSELQSANRLNQTQEARVSALTELRNDDNLLNTRLLRSQDELLEQQRSSIEQRDIVINRQATTITEQSQYVNQLAARINAFKCLTSNLARLLFLLDQPFRVSVLCVDLLKEMEQMSVWTNVGNAPAELRSWIQVEPIIGDLAFYKVTATRGFLYALAVVTDNYVVCQGDIVQQILRPNELIDTGERNIFLYEQDRTFQSIGARYNSCLPKKAPV